MSKSDTRLEEIDLSSVFNQQSSPSWAGDKSINAFDTETSDGDVFMLSYAIEGDSGVIYNENVEKMDNTRLFDKITHRNCRSCLNFWYNLDFDVNALLSDVLNGRELTELNIQNNTTTYVNDIEYEITYVKSKFLKIEDENGNKYDHYDISQFFYTSLDNAAEEWLGENKIEEVDTQKFGSSTCVNHDKETINQSDKDLAEVMLSCEDCHSKREARAYVKANFDKILEYAEKDATLTQRLGEELVNQAEELDIPMGEPYSTGYLSAEYLRANTVEKPRFGKFEYQQMFWNAYYGGRFEVFERGEVGEVVAPDINSAYPAIMQNLPDPSSLKWQRYSNEVDSSNEGFASTTEPFDFETICNHDYGVVRAIVTTDPNARIQPFAYKIDGKVNFPVLTETEITVIKPIFEFAVKNNLVLDYRLKESWLAKETERTKYPFQFIEDIYGERKVLENLDGKKKKGKLLKIVLNSLYGKTCQSTEKRNIYQFEEGEGNYELNSNEKIVPIEFMSHTQRNLLEENEVVLQELRAGKRFNPFIASYITGMTRLELHKQVVNHNLVEDTVMFATDCIMVKKDAYESSDFEQLINVPSTEMDREQYREAAKQSLGYWDFDYQGEAFIVGSGVYEVDFGYCKKSDCRNYEQWCDNDSHRMKTKTRGFTEKDLGDTLRNIAEKNPKAIPIENERPLTIAEVLISPDRGSVSEFIAHSKELRPNFDTKRRWKRANPDYHDLLRKSEDSKPIDLAKRQEEALKAVQEENDSSIIENPLASQEVS